MTLVQEAEIRLKKMYEDLNDDDPSVMQISAAPHSEVSAEPRLNMLQVQRKRASSMRMSTHTGSSTITQRQETSNSKYSAS